MIEPRARILVVDDAPWTRGLLMQVLKKYGYQVDTAEDGQQAIDYFIDHHPDLIMMDADMPVLDGVAACARLRELPEARYLPIIIVTAFVEREWVDRAYAAGATDFITKPINWDVLRNRIHYILQAKQAEEALFQEKEKAQVTLASIGDGVITTDAWGRVEYLNAVASKLTGWQTEEALGLPLSQVFSIIDEHSQQPIAFPIHRCLEEGKMVELSDNTVLVHRQQHKRFAIEDSAAPIKDRHGHIIGVVLVFHDVSETRKMTQELSYKAKHDALTGLINLHEFKLRLKQVLTPPFSAEHALLYMDLDQFKQVNDTCGHEAGDQLLKDVALLLQQQLAHYAGFAQATLARLGGDEFGLLLEQCPLAVALEIANSFCERIYQFKFFWLNQNQEKGVFTIGISIGLVPITAYLNHQQSLLAMADAACYAAKNAGRNQVRVYQKSDSQSLDYNIQWVAWINENIEKNQGFSLFYQAIEPCHPHQVTGHEILLRMTDPQGNLVLPGAFLSAASRYNLMTALDLWVIRTTLNWLKQHQQQLEQLLFCSINVSAAAISDSHFLKTLTHLIEHTPIPAEKLCFEISEPTAITYLTGVIEFMTTLKQLGCQLTLDDFGSGLSSFAYLKQLPVDFLKIDSALISTLATDAIDEALVQAINDIAQRMGLKTIAEGVENQIILDKLKIIGVDYVQGYWLSEPQALAP